MVLKKSKNWSKTLPWIINYFLILFRKTWWFFEICQKAKTVSYFILIETPNLRLLKFLGPDITTINGYGTSWGLFYFFISLKTYGEYLTHEKLNVSKKNFTVNKTLLICIGILVLNDLNDPSLRVSWPKHMVVRGHLEMMSLSHDFLLSAEQFKFHT